MKSAQLNPEAALATIAMIISIIDANNIGAVTLRLLGDATGSIDGMFLVLAIFASFI